MVKQGESNYNYLGNDEIKEMCNNWKNEIVWKEVFETENVEDDMNVISLNDDGGAVEGTNVQDPPEEAGTVNDGGALEGMNVEYGGALEEGTNVQDPSKEARTVKDGGGIVGGNNDTVAINVEHGGALEGYRKFDEAMNVKAI